MLKSELVRGLHPPFSEIMTPENPNFENRYQAWLNTLDKWCGKHQITRTQAVSILFDDGKFNPDGPNHVTSKDVLEWNEVQSFVSRFSELDRIDRPIKEVASSFLFRCYRAELKLYREWRERAPDLIKTDSHQPHSAPRPSPADLEPGCKPSET